jgi:hypothetical protein
MIPGLGRLSRSSSQNSIAAAEELQNLGLRQNELQASNEQINIPADPDPSISLSESIKFTKEHPLGAILIKFAQDNTALARKANLCGVETNINELCTSFHTAIQLEKSDMENKFLKTHREIEDSIIHKELNSHQINTAINPPKIFSPIPTLTSGAKLTEALKLFPRNIKFSGLKQDNGMSVTEFLNIMKVAQDHAQLSEEEFIDRMLSCSTGLAHELILEWKTNGENVQTIYHNLLINFDKRLSAEEAKQQLLSYKISKNSTLAKAESSIMLLASRAASQMPEGSSRIAYYNLEACNTIIRALPPLSSSNVNNLYNQLSARLGRAATFAELSRAMNLYRVSIDSDIKANGAVNQFKIKKYPDINFKGRTGGLRSKFTAYSLNVTHQRNPYESQRSSVAKGAYNNNVSFTPKPLNTVRPLNNSNRYNLDRKNEQRWDPRRRNINNGNNRNRFNINNNAQIRNCSYCGMRGHKAQDCHNIVSDSGKRIELLPTQGTCTKCPSRISPRLHHPEALCPYRVGGPLNKN